MNAPSTLHRSPQGETGNAGTAAVFPRRAALLIGGSVVASLAGVTIARLTGWQAVHADAPTVQERALHFRDQSDGGVAVLDADTGHTLQVLHGEQGFLRGTLRGMARERRRRGLGSEAPLHLLGRADGRLTLLDKTTGQRYDLESFGPTNAAIYARWLDMPAAPLAATARP
ncbi:MAG: photosynthetic complex assembly protein PuhC [Rubrivivax sp.]